MKISFQLVLSKVAFLLCGYFLVALGISLGVVSNLGLSPWDVFAQGLGFTLNVNIGTAGIIISLTVMTLAMLIKVLPGIGTLFNIFFIGIFTNLIVPNLSTPPNFILCLLVNILGVICLALGSAMYLNAKTGAGPRDSLLLGVVHKTKISTKYIKPIIEGIVLVIGILLGGTFGIGTIIALLLMGYFMDIFFKFFNYNPKEVKQLNFIEQIAFLKGELVNENSGS
ncbi:hypothetical protein LJB88_04595 [Erysipelotrichaceae bacterium OttesenSCG-928-M19]|nr:hypothetical protein [Erysipelotrichaceae bacterium OttesenSCG-928-M19]